MAPLLRVEKIEAPNYLNEAGSYGSSFSRGTKVAVNGVEFFFISGTASVDENGDSVHQGNLAKQIERMCANIEGLLCSAGANIADLVRTVTYVKPGSFDEAFKGLSANRIITNGSWFKADICRTDLLIETDALAVKVEDSVRDNPRVKDILAFYENCQSDAMVGQPRDAYTYKVELNGFIYLFIFDSSVDDSHNHKINSGLFERNVRSLYRRITNTLDQNNARWQDVVNTRINLPRLLAVPPDLTDDKYYALFNPIRTRLFRDNTVCQYPSSTCVGTKTAHENLIISMSVMAIYPVRQ